MTLFDKFGGVRQMAGHLSEAPSTVQSWKTAGRVPAGHQPRILQVAQDLDLPVTADDLIFPLGRDEADRGGEDHAYADTVAEARHHG